MKTLIVTFICLISNAHALNEKYVLLQTTHYGDPLQWYEKVIEVANLKNPIIANYAITRAHYELGLGLRETIGGEGANFHIWATWGSYKAGVTIRKEDSELANYIASLVENCNSRFGHFRPSCIAGKMTRKKLELAAREISMGNRLVLEDIGGVTAKFITLFHNAEAKDDFKFGQFRNSIRADQEMLKHAFSAYYRAKFEVDEELKEQFIFLGNLYAIYHEHIKLQPIIKRSLPLEIRKISSISLLKFLIGDEELYTGFDITHYHRNGRTIYPEKLMHLRFREVQAFFRSMNRSEGLDYSKASDWTKFDQRMNFVSVLFRTRHFKPELWDYPASETYRW